jgi:hypothetical protein
MGPRNLPHKADNLTAICEPNVYTMWEPRHLTTLKASMACWYCYNPNPCKVMMSPTACPLPADEFESSGSIKKRNSASEPTFADRGCHVVIVSDQYGHTLGFLDRSPYFFFQAAPQLYSRVDPVPDPQKIW